MPQNGNLPLNMKAIFLDRDGVLNKPNIVDNKPFAPKFYKDFILYPDVKDFINSLRQFAYKLIVVTNQKDVGRGITSRDSLDKMHAFLKAQIQFDDIYVCTCIDNCYCYKPNPGMLIKAKKKWKLNLVESFIIGDTWRDVGAGIRVGCKTIFIDRKYNIPMPYEPNYKVNSLSEAKDVIIKFTREI